MAQVIRYVDPDVVGGTGDGTSWEDAYASLNAWNAAEATNLVTNDDYHTVYCRSSGGTNDTTPFDLYGWNTDATHYIEIIGFDFPSNGVYDNTKYVLYNNDSAEVTLSFSENYIRIINLQILVTETGSNTRHGIKISGIVGSNEFLIDSCIIKGVCSGTGAAWGIYTNDNDINLTVINTIVYDFVSGTDTGFQGIRADNCNTFNIYNCTVYNCYGVGIYLGATGTMTVKNTAVGLTNNDFGQYSGTLIIDHCCSDDGDGTNPQNPSGGNWSNEFKNPGTDFSLLQNGNCVNNGVDDPGSGLYSDDIRGLERSSNWDIGAFEYGSLFKMDILAVSSLAMNLVSVSFAPLIGRWTWPVSEWLILNTEILESHNRTEQRIAKRQGIPAQYYGTRLLLECDDEFATFEAMIHSWLRKKWRLPIWPEAEIHTGNLPSGSGSISMDTRYADFRVDGYALIWQSKEHFEVVTISAIADNLLTLSSNTEKTFWGDKFIMPVRTGRSLAPGRIERHQGGALVDMRWRIEDVEAVNGFSAEMTYDGYTVLTKPAAWLSGFGQTEHDADIALLDAGTGPFEIINNADFNRVSQSHGWAENTKAECWYFRQLLHDIKGRQKAVLVPTFRDDLTLTRPLGAAATEIYIRHGNFTRNMGLNDLRTYLAFRPPGSDIIVRKITGINVVNDNEEKIEINTAPGQAFEPGDHLCWVDRCRLAYDDIELTWHGRGKCMVDTPLERITA